MVVCDVIRTAIGILAKHRFAGAEEPAIGKGAVWEGRLLRQMLYEDGKNDRIVPVVFEQTDIDHIPLELKDATYYDVGTDSGYAKLHRALTAQPLVERIPVGPALAFARPAGT